MHVANFCRAPSPSPPFKPLRMDKALHSHGIVGARLLITRSLIVYPEPSVEGLGIRQRVRNWYDKHSTRYDSVK